MDKVITVNQFLITSDVVFHDKQNFTPVTLKSLPKKSAIALIADLLHRYNKRQKADIKFQFNILKSFVLEGTVEMQQTVKAFFSDHPGLESEPGLKFIDRRPFLNLLQNLLVYADDTFESPLTKLNIDTLFRTIILLNQDEARAQEIVFNWDHSQPISAFADQVLRTQFRSIEIDRLKEYKTQFLKVYYFFEFCQSDSKYADHLITFLRNKGVLSYSSYLWKIFTLSLELFEEGEFREVLFAEEDTELGHFLNSYIINDKIVDTDIDFRLLRSYPFYKLTNNHYLLLNYNFFIDKFYHGFLFDFAAASELNFGNLRNDMGRLFSEPVMFYKVMQRCFNTYGDIRLSGYELKQLLGFGEPDYYIRNGNDIFLFEFKDLIINAIIKNAGNAEELKAGIYKKLEENEKGKPKGITQLINSIKSINNGSYASFNVDGINFSSVHIYPIVVHSDVVLESFGVNYIMSKRFNEKLSVEASFSNVSDVVLLNVDTLIQMQDHFSSGKIELKDCIESYFLYIDSDEAPTATYPFDEFIKHHFRKKTGEVIGVPKEFREVTNKLKRDALKN